MKKFAMRTGTATIASVSFLAICGPAFAQGQSNDTEALQASANAADIIVTARRVEERLQDVPISISVVSQDDLTRRNVVNQADLASFVPSLTINQRFGPEKSSFVIRGFTQENRTSPSVGTYFAEVVVPRAQSGTTSGNSLPPGSFFDLQNVQVLKGPQGTLFGRNTTGGAVLIVPQRPTDRLEGYLEGSAGNYDMWRVQGVLNVPLADTFKIRGGFERSKRDGYLRNHGSGPDLNDADYLAARLSAEMDLTPDLQNYIVATYNRSDGNGFGAHMQICNPAPTATTARVLAPLACAQIARQKARGDGLLDVEGNIADPFIKLRVMQIIDHVTWRVSDTLTVKNIASYSSTRERVNFSNSGENFVVPATGALFGTVPAEFVGRPYNYISIRNTSNRYATSQESFTEELQLIGNSANGRFKWQLGGYLEISNPLGFSSTTIPVGLSCTDPANPFTGCANPLGIGAASFTNAKTWFNNKGFYAQATYDITDQFSITGGFRYTIDKIRALGQVAQGRYRLPTAGGAGVRGTFQDLTCSNTLLFPGSPSVSDISQCSASYKALTKQPTWLIDLDWKPSRDILIYAKYSRGYRQGGIDPSLFGIEVWKPEKLDSYEVGAKTTFSTGSVHGTFNFAGYYNDFTNQQITVALTRKAGITTGASSAIVAAGKSRIYGAEFDSSLTFFRDVRLDVGYSYLNTKLQSFPAITFDASSPFATATPNAQLGGELTYSPKHRVTATATYTLPLDESVGRISLSGSYTYTASQISTSAANSPIFQLPAENLFNLNLDWKGLLGQPVDLSFFVNNLTNKVYPVAVTQGYVSNGWDGYIVSPPRMYGVRLRFRFGS